MHDKLAQTAPISAKWHDGGETFKRIMAHRQEEERQRKVIDLSYEPMSQDSKGIVREICQYRGVTSMELRSRSRVTRLVRARQEIAYWLRRKTKLSFPQIGIKLDRDHTTILHSVRTYAEKHSLPIPERK